MTDRTIPSIFSYRTDNLRTKVVGIYGVLVTGNVAAWIWAVVTFRDSPVLGIEALGLVGVKLLLRGPFWKAIHVVNNNPRALGCAIVALYIVTWLISFVLYSANGYDRIGMLAESAATAALEEP